MQIIKTIPLFFILLLLYNVVVIGLKSEKGSEGPPPLKKQLHTFTLPSDEQWPLTVEDVFIIMGIMVLYIEILKSTRSGTITIVEHTLSVFVFIAYLMEFMMSDLVVYSSFVYLGCMSLVDVLAGFTISIAAARRDFQISG
ncbi:MAG: hypothetical protein D6748_16390 [Calditrichaeota bacterium]|nr:MAG: hypothetical protein D6748_16390 [Calditrichota bacterium]